MTEYTLLYGGGTLAILLIAALIFINEHWNTNKGAKS